MRHHAPPMTISGLSWGLGEHITWPRTHGKAAEQPQPRKVFQGIRRNTSWTAPAEVSQWDCTHGIGNGYVWLLPWRSMLDIYGVPPQRIQDTPEEILCDHQMDSFQVTPFMQTDAKTLCTTPTGLPQCNTHRNTACMQLTLNVKPLPLYPKSAMVQAFAR